MKKCINCDKDLPCDAEYCDECGALQWKYADLAKKFIRFQQILVNILIFFNYFCSALYSSIL